MTSPRNQSGAALIMVLLFLLLITTAGLIAVRQSRMDLKVSTTNQVDGLLLNTSDSVLAHIERAITTPGTPDYKNITATNKGVLGYFMLHPGVKSDQQVVFCYTPARRVTIFDLTNSIIRFPNQVTTQSGARVTTNGGTQGSGGICDPSQSSNYATARNVALTQVVIRGMNDGAAGAAELPLEGLEVGSSFGEQALNSPNPRMALYGVSVLPGLSNTSNANIKECFGKPVPPIKDAQGRLLYGTETEDMITCLQKQNVPATALVEEVVVRKESQGWLDKPLCHTDATDTVKAECEAAGIPLQTLPSS